MASHSNGRPEAEVIANFQDGLSYSKGKLEAALASVLDVKPSAAKETVKCKKEDVDLIEKEFEIPRARAEKALIANDGDLKRTILALINRTV